MLLNYSQKYLFSKNSNLCYMKGNHSLKWSVGKNKSCIHKALNLLLHLTIVQYVSLRLTKGIGFISNTWTYVYEKIY